MLHVEDLVPVPDGNGKPVYLRDFFDMVVERRVEAQHDQLLISIVLDRFQNAFVQYGFVELDIFAVSGDIVLVDHILNI